MLNLVYYQIVMIQDASLSTVKESGGVMNNFKIIAYKCLFIRIYCGVSNRIIYGLLNWIRKLLTISMILILKEIITTSFSTIIN